MRFKRGTPAMLTVWIQIVLGGAAALAASPPQLLNYQGVLRDNANAPLNGTFTMVFRLMEGGGGNEILVDSHQGAASGVIVTNGLFNVAIGSGAVTDGTGPGSYTSLGNVFRDYADVLLRIEVNAQVLSPDVPIASAAYALNATHFDGLIADQFVRTDIDDVAFGKIWFSGTPIGSSIGGGPVFVSPASANANDTLLGLAVSFQERFRVDAEGDTFIGPNLHMANGVQMWDNGFGLQIYAGNEDTDDLFLRAGNSSDDGSITIVGDGLMQFRSGDGTFSFAGPSGNILLMTGDTFRFQDGLGTDTATLTSGDLTIGNDLRLTDTGLFNQSIISTPNNLQIWADDQLITIFDADRDDPLSAAEWWHGVGFFSIEQLAELQSDGDFHIRGTYSNNVAFDLAESFVSTEPMEPGDVVSVDPSRPDAVRRSAGSEDRAVIGVVSTRPGFLLGGVPFDAGAMRAAWGEAVHDEFQTARAELRERVLSNHGNLRADLEAAHLAHTASPVPEKDASDLVNRLESDLEGLALEMFHKERFVPVALAGRVPVKVDAWYGSIQVGDLLTSSPTPGHAMRADDPRPGTVIGKALEALESGTGKISVLVMLR